MSVQNTIDGLRAVADLLSIHREFLDEHGYQWPHNDDEQTYISFYTGVKSATFSVHGPDAKELGRELRRRLRRSKWEKDTYHNTFVLHTPYDYGENAEVALRIEFPRDLVCERKVIGTETKIVPAVEAQPEHTEEVEIVEWDCGNLLEDEVAK